MRLSSPPGLPRPSGCGILGPFPVIMDYKRRKRMLRRLVFILPLLSLAAGASLYAADTRDPNKPNAAADADKIYRDSLKLTHPAADPLKQYEDAMKPIYDLTIRETTAGIQKDKNNAV